MGWYERVVFARLLDGALDIPTVWALREAVLAPAAGEILEVGVGTGLNFARYPPSVKRVTAVTRDEALHERAAARAARRGIAVEHVRGDAQALPFPDERFDTVVCSFLLCSLPDPARAAREMARVLKRDGRLLVMEHVAAEGARRAYQRLVEPLNRVVTGGCRLLRDTRSTLAGSGFLVGELVTADVEGVSLPHRRVLRGTARRSL